MRKAWKIETVDTEDSAQKRVAVSSVTHYRAVGDEIPCPDQPPS